VKTPPALTRDQLRQRAAAWAERELQRAAHGHGARWQDNESWVKDYVRQELRERLEVLHGRP
jgi:hypothetical protein